MRTQNKTLALGASALSASILESYASANTPIPNAQVTNTALQGLVTSYTYFATPNVISVTESSAGSDPRVTHTTLDRLDRVSKMVTPNPVTGLTTTSGDQREAGGFVTSFGYDNLGNLLAVTDGLSTCAGVIQHNYIVKVDT